MDALASYLPYLLIGGMVLMMLRGGGCCGGHRHGGGHGHGNSSGGDQNAIDMVRDPVCGMMVNKKEALKAVVEGKEYCFCSEACLKSFTATN